jgi:hypothetical protein
MFDSLENLKSKTFKTTLDVPPEGAQRALDRFLHFFRVNPFPDAGAM